jgi:hypothetical protein
MVDADAEIVGNGVLLSFSLPLLASLPIASSSVLERRYHNKLLERSASRGTRQDYSTRVATFSCCGGVAEFRPRRCSKIHDLRALALAAPAWRPGTRPANEYNVHGFAVNAVSCG